MAGSGEGHEIKNTKKFIRRRTYNIRQKERIFFSPKNIPVRCIN